jgi:hypothetical protein
MFEEGDNPSVHHQVDSAYREGKRAEHARAVEIIKALALMFYGRRCWCHGINDPHTTTCDKARAYIEEQPMTKCECAVCSAPDLPAKRIAVLDQIRDAANRIAKTHRCTVGISGGCTACVDLVNLDEGIAVLKDMLGDKE